MSAHRRMLLAAAVLVASVGFARGQGYPSQTVRIVVPFSAGSSTDSLARVLSDELTKLWKQSVVVENRPGIAGTNSVAKSADSCLNRSSTG